MSLASAFNLTATELGFAVPSGVVLAAVISFLALRWSTNRTVENQQKSLDKTLRVQVDQTNSTLAEQRRQHQDALRAQRLQMEYESASQRILNRDQRLFDRRSNIYLEFMAAARVAHQKLAGLSKDVNYDLCDRYSKDAQYWVAELVVTRNSIDLFGGDDVRRLFDEYQKQVSATAKLCEMAYEAWQGYNSGDPMCKPAGTPEEIWSSTLRAFVTFHDKMIENHEKLIAAMRSDLQSVKIDKP